MSTRKIHEKIEPDSTEEAEPTTPLGYGMPSLPITTEDAEPKPTPQKTAPKPDKINAMVKCCFIETRDGIRAKRGDTIEIATDPKKHTPALELAIKTGNVVVDLAPVVSETAE